MLPRLPLCEGGKVDWRELQAMLDRRLDADAAGLPRTRGLESWPGLTLRAFRLALGQPDLGQDADFMEAGGDSLRALIAVRMLTQECGVPDLCVLDLIEHPTAERLAELIATREPSTRGRGGGSAQMEQDAGLPADSVIRTGRRPAGELRTVLVTGATGFVGSRLVHDLLASTDLRVLCLARAADDTEAAERVVASAGRTGPVGAAVRQPAGGIRGRPEPARPRAAPPPGTTSPAPVTWCCTTAPWSTCCSATPRTARPTSRAPRRCCALAMTHGRCRCTTSPRCPPCRRRRCADPAACRRSDLLPADPPERGYSRSKWVAERYLAQARRRGATVTVLRLGEVLPSEQHPAPNARALTHLLLSAIHQLGAAPDAPIRSDYTPVDYASARVVAAVLDRAAWGRALHVFHPHSVDFAGALARAGAPVTRTSCAEFLARLTRTAQETGEHDTRRAGRPAPGPGRADEAALRRELSDLLTDNAALYRKDECRRLEQRWRLADEDLRGPIAAYHGYLATRDDAARTARAGGAPARSHGKA